MREAGEQGTGSSSSSSGGRGGVRGESHLGRGRVRVHRFLSSARPLFVRTSYTARLLIPATSIKPSMILQIHTGFCHNRVLFISGAYPPTCPHAIKLRNPATTTIPRQHESMSNESYLLTFTVQAFVSILLQSCRPCSAEKPVGIDGSEPRPYSCRFSSHKSLIISLLQPHHRAASAPIRRVRRKATITTSESKRRLETGGCNNSPDRRITAVEPHERSAGIVSCGKSPVCPRGAFQDSQRGTISCGGVSCS